MLNQYESYKKQKHTQLLQSTEYLIKLELARSLPKLSENEKLSRRNLIKNLTYNKITRKDKLKDFYDEIRKKYTDNKELAYLSDSEFLHELYNYIIGYDIYKKKFTDLVFELPKWLVWLVGKNKDTKISEKELKDNFQLKNSQALVNNSSSWCSINFDNDFFEFIKNSEFSTLTNLIKYDNTIQSDSILIYQTVYYDQLNKFINEFFYTNTKARKIYYRFIDNQKFKETIGNDNTKVYSIDKYDPNSNIDWQEDCNKILNTLLQIILYELETIEVLILIVDASFYIELDKTNTELLTKIIEKKESLEIFSIYNIGIYPDSEVDFADKLNANKYLKFVTVKNARLSSNVMTSLENVGRNKIDYIFTKVTK